jgi:hypothetical protein
VLSRLTKLFTSGECLWLIYLLQGFAKSWSHSEHSESSLGWEISAWSDFEKRFLLGSNFLFLGNRGSDQVVGVRSSRKTLVFESNLMQLNFLEFRNWTCSRIFKFHKFSKASILSVQTILSIISLIKTQNRLCFNLNLINILINFITFHKNIFN